MSTSTDFSTSGLRLEGSYENDRNMEGSPVFKAIVKEVFNVTDVICGHHIIYEIRDTRKDGFTYDVVQEIPSADALIFDHDIALKIWGDDFQHTLIQLALEPTATRDKLLAELYNNRSK